MKIYLASMYDRREELLAYKAELEADGHEVTSRWLNGSHEAKGDDTRETWAQFARDDLQVIDESDVVIEFTEAPFTMSNNFSARDLNVLKRGGRHVEFGYAWATDKLLVLVGPRENVFHNLLSVHQFNTWPEAKAFIAGLQEVLGAA